MFKKLTQALTVLGISIMLMGSANTTLDANAKVPEEVFTKTVHMEVYASTPAAVKTVEIKEMKVPDFVLTEEEIELIALVTMAEAEGECEEGKRLVIDTILNRLESEISYYPDTVHGVIYQKNAFESMWNGRVDRVEATDEVIQLVREEIESRTNTDVFYFCAGGYSIYGTPLFRVGNHYFSGN